MDGTYGFFALMMLFALLCLAAMGLNHQARMLTLLAIRTLLEISIPSQRLACTSPGFALQSVAPLSGRPAVTSLIHFIACRIS